MAADSSVVFEAWGSWEEARAAMEPQLNLAGRQCLQDAYDFAASCHRGQLTPSGLPYVRHLLTVVEVLVRGLDVTDADLLMAALLHDVVEDTNCSLAIVEERFGARVRGLVGWLTARPPASGESPALARSHYLSSFNQAPDDVLLIKLADRLANVQRLDTHPRPEKQRRYYQETVEQVLPLAARIPWFERWFAAWRVRFRYLSDPGH